MRPFSVATVSLMLLLGLLIVGRHEVSFGPAWSLRPTATQPTDVTIQKHPLLYRVDLRPEAESSMFQGTIEAVDLSRGSVIVKTDHGRTLILLSYNCQEVTALRKGDRVLLEADVRDVLMVTPIEKAMREVQQQSPEAASQLAWTSGRCAETFL